MIYNNIGKSCITGSVFHLGAFSFSFDLSSPEIKEAIATIHMAIELGINVFDTAEGYADGDSERLLAYALKGKREKVHIASKVSYGNLRAPDVRNACEGSLSRLETDYLDIEYIHIPNQNIPIEETMGELLRLKQEGKIKAIGISNFSKEEISNASSIGQVDIVQNVFSLIWRWMEDDIIPYCNEKDIAFTPCSPLVQGILTGKFSLDTNTHKLDSRKGIQLFSDKYFAKAMVVAEGVKYLAKKYNKTATQVALNWTINHYGINSVVVGVKNRTQLEENLGAIGWSMDTEDTNYINKLSRTITDDLPRDISFWWEGKADW